MRARIALLLAVAIAPAAALAPAPLRAEPQPLRATDLYRFRDVGAARSSPDGARIAYTITTVDSGRTQRTAMCT
jgi:hypothetical protein